MNHWFMLVGKQEHWRFEVRDATNRVVPWDGDDVYYGSKAKAKRAAQTALGWQSAPDGEVWMEWDLAL